MRDIARRLRKNMTPQAVKLWAHLRRLRKSGVHFRRQSPFRAFVLDFVCHEARIVIEVDGSHHNEIGHRERDAKRDALLEDHGYAVLRFWNNEIDYEMDAVWRVISDALRAAQARTHQELDHRSP
jgi:very-short-patch-repair endonuclease